MPSLVYLTADHGVPAPDIEESIGEFCRKRPGAPAPVIAWLSWRHLDAVVGEFDAAAAPLKDLAMLLDRFGLRLFHGIRSPDRLPGNSWRFAEAPVQFDWQGLAGCRMPEWLGTDAVGMREAYGIDYALEDVPATP